MIACWSLLLILEMILDGKDTAGCWSSREQQRPVMPGHKEGGREKVPHRRGDLAMKVAVALKTRYLFMAVPWSAYKRHSHLLSPPHLSQ